MPLSPPKKWSRLLTADSPASSPSEGPLKDDGDHESPSFRAKSFYGRKRVTAHLLQSCLSVEKLGSSVPAAKSPSSATTENAIKTPPRGTRSAGGNGFMDDEKITGMSPRIALTPIKNIYGSVKKQSKTKLKNSAASVTGKRRKSLPAVARVYPVTPTRYPPAPQAVEPSDEDPPVSATTPNNRKFFKHKSPASASRAVGGIIIGKGFNLKFVRGSLNKDFGQSPCKKRGIATKKRSAPKAHNTYSRTVAKSPKVAVAEKKAQVTCIRNVSEVAAASMASSPDVDSNMSEDESLEPGSQSLFNSDTLSLASNMSAPMERHLPAATDSQSPLSSSSPDEGRDKFFYSVFSKKRVTDRG